jgi:hypothetical protein
VRLVVDDENTALAGLERCCLHRNRISPVT